MLNDSFDENVLTTCRDAAPPRLTPVLPPRFAKRQPNAAGDVAVPRLYRGCCRVSQKIKDHDLVKKPDNLYRRGIATSPVYFEDNFMPPPFDQKFLLQREARHFETYCRPVQTLQVTCFFGKENSVL